MSEGDDNLSRAIQRARPFAERNDKRDMDSYSGIPVFAAPGLHAAALAQLQNHLPPGSRVLDLGAGAGAFSRRMADAGFAVTACDLFEGNFVPRNEVPFTVADLNGAFSKVIGGVWDAIVALELIEHLENPRHVLRECSRLLPGGGLLMLSTPNLANPVSQALFLLTQDFQWFSEQDYRTQGHITPLAPRILARCASELGLTLLWQGSVSNPFRQLWGRRNLSKRVIGAAMGFLSGTPRELQGEVYLGIWRVS